MFQAGQCADVKGTFEMWANVQVRINVHLAGGPGLQAGQCAGQLAVWANVQVRINVHLAGQCLGLDVQMSRALLVLGPLWAQGLV